MRTRNRIGHVIGAAVLATALSTTGVSAQLFPGLGNAKPGEDALSLGVVFGQMGPQTRFRDGGGFLSSNLIGGSVTFWPGKYAGLQFSVTWTDHGTTDATDGRESVVTGRDPKIQTYQGDLLFRYPVLLEHSTLSLSPYAGIGGGWKYYNWTWDSMGGRDARGMDGAWSYIGGLEVRFGPQSRLGVRGEFRDLRTKFARYGEDLTHKDRVFTGGILINF